MAEGPDRTEIMVFRPTMDEFRDFSSYISYMERCGAHKCGGAKVIPPKGWFARRSYDDLDLEITCPIEQSFSGGQGLFRLFNVQKKSIGLSQFRELAVSEKFKPPVNVDDFDEIDRRYWKSLMFNPPMYGADLAGSLFDADVRTWNVSRLDSILTQIQDIRIPGVNTPYLYFGMWRSTFAWHTEDMDLYSINYLHFGAPKTWYFVPDEHGQRIERLAKGFFPGDAQNCASFLRHKATLISPNILRQYSIPVNKVTQEAGQFIVTFPYSYHCGFNHGFNCAESTNFATERWIDYGIKASQCFCQGDTVHIDMEVFIKKYKPHLLETYRASKMKNGYGLKTDSVSPESANRPRRGSVRKRPSIGDEDLAVKKPKVPKSVPRQPFDMAVFFEEVQFNQHCAQNNTCCCVCSLFEMPRPKISYPGGPVKGDEPKPKPQSLTHTFPPPANHPVPPPPYHVAVPTAPFPYGSSSVHPNGASVYGSYWTPPVPSSVPHHQHQQGGSVSVAGVVNNVFSRGEFESHSSNQNSSDEGTLIVCSRCGICVHKECYGLLDREVSSSWQCKRCERQSWDEVCVLCNLRGGALKLTDTSQPKWAHIACAVAIPEVSFGNYKIREPIHVKAIQKERWALRCRYCIASGRPIRGTCVQCSGPRCITSFHVTCAYRAGLLIRLSDTVVQFFCSKHSQGNLEEDGLHSSICIGTPVAAKFSSSEYAWATVVGVESVIYFVVLFDDGSISHNVRPSDVKNVRCSSDRFPKENQRVEILWSDGDMYGGKFMKAITQSEYRVQFPVGDMKTVENDELFEAGKVPAKKIKFVKAPWNVAPAKLSLMASN